MSHTGLKSLDDVAQTICLPNERAPVRLPTYPSIDKTALFRYRYQNTQSLRDTAPSSALNVMGRKRFVVTRDPAAPMLVDSVHYLQNTISGNPLYYTGSVLVRSESFATTAFATGSTITANTMVSVDFDKMYTFEYYSTLPCGELDSKQWFLVPKILEPTGRSTGFLDRIGVGLFRTSLTADLNRPVKFYRQLNTQTQEGTIFPNPQYPAGTYILDYTVTFEIVRADGMKITQVMEYDYTFDGIPAVENTGFSTFDTTHAMVRIQSLTYSGPLKVIQPNGFPAEVQQPANLYPALVLALGGASVGVAQPTPFRCLSLPPTSVNPEYYNSVAPFRSTRINASALLLTNVTKVLNKEGTVESSRLLFNPLQGQTVHDADVTLVSTSNPETRYFGALEKGAYTFTAPDQESLEFSTPYQVVNINDQGSEFLNMPSNFAFTSARAVERPVLNLKPRYVNCLVLSDLDTSDDSQFAMTLDTHWEFRTVSTLYQLDYSRMPIEVYHAAMLACMRAGFFYENNTHQKILNAVGKGLKYAAPLVPGGNIAQLAHSAAQSVLDHRNKKKKTPPTAGKSNNKHGKGTMKQKGFK